MATAHLIHGYLGAGKTTFARRLEVERRAVRFTPDEWMAGLFGEDPPENTFQRNLTNVLRLLEDLWLRCLVLGVDVVLDYGFWRRAERNHVRAIVKNVGAEVALYRLTCPDEEARTRVGKRNLDEGRSLFIAPATFETLKSRFEPLDSDEPYSDVTA